MSIEDQPTQQIRRVPPAAPLPGPLNPARPEPAPADREDAGSTEVLSLDDLFAPSPAAPAAPAEFAPEATTVAAPQVAEPPVAPAPVAPAPVAPAPVAPAPVASAPVASPAQSTSMPAPEPQRIGAVPVAKSRPEPGLRDRVRGDASAAWRSGMTRTRGWLSAGDNVVIVATVLVALLLLLAVATL